MKKYYVSYYYLGCDTIPVIKHTVIETSPVGLNWEFFESMVESEIKITVKVIAWSEILD